MDPSLIFGRHWLATDTFDDDEDQTSAVQGRQREKVKHTYVMVIKATISKRKSHPALDACANSSATRTGPPN